MGVILLIWMPYRAKEELKAALALVQRRETGWAVLVIHTPVGINGIDCKGDS